MENSINKFFPTPVLSVDTNCSQKVRVGMLQYASDLIADNTKCGESGAIIGLSSEKNRYKHVCIHKLPEFQWLNKQIGMYCKEYLQCIGIDPDECNVYAQKSWAVIKKDANFAVKEHDHTGAVLSAVYYVEAQPNDPPIVFVNPKQLLQELPLHTSIQTEDNHQYMAQDSVTGKLLIFPANLKHFVPGVGPVQGERISVSYDIMVTNKEDSSSLFMGNRILDPVHWSLI